MTTPGPKSESAKAAVRYNAVQHGILSSAPVVAGFEHEEDWHAHRTGVLTSLAPEGQLEQVLAERVALTLWRLQRVARYEHEAIAVAQEQIEADIAKEQRDDARLRVGEPADDEVNKAAERLATVLELSQLQDMVPLHGRQAVAVLTAACELAGVEPEDVNLSGVRPRPLWIDARDWVKDYRDWTARQVRLAIQQIIGDARTTSVDAIAALAAYLREQVAAATAARDQAEIERIDRMRRLRLLPDEALLQKITRYEAHLNRQLYHALHELEAMKARRHDEAAPLARLDVHGIPEA